MNPIGRPKLCPAITHDDELFFFPFFGRRRTDPAADSKPLPRCLALRLAGPKSWYELRSDASRFKSVPKLMEVGKDGAQTVTPKQRWEDSPQHAQSYFSSCKSVRSICNKSLE